jgi:hypothetical protein
MATEARYILIDLERTLGIGMIHFWKQNKHGYTTEPHEAGEFSHKDASKEFLQDHNNQTIVFPARQFKKILKRYGEW